MKENPVISSQNKSHIRSGAGGLTNLQSTFFQPKLKINHPNDFYEQEADAMAERVMRMPSSPTNHSFFQPTPIAITPLQRKCAACEDEEKLQRKEDNSEMQPAFSSLRVLNAQRKCAHCEEEEKLQMKESGTAGSESAATPAVYQVINSKGQTIDDGTRTFMESRFGYDFSNVRIHNDTLAHKSSADINALAYTHGNHIVFGSRQFQPETDTGKRLLAHELTHVIQQKSNTPSAVFRKSTDKENADDPVPTPAASVVPDFGETPAEPSCPKNPTKLGDVNPDPPCEESDVEIEGEKFYFCTGSDAFKNPSDAGKLKNFVRSQPANTSFEVHAYASSESGYSNQEKNKKYNLNLACHRAKRTARSMINAGVRSEKIHIVNKGLTERFGAGKTEKALALNRVVQVASSSDSDLKIEEPEFNNKRELLKIAVDKLLNGEYRLAADAYINLWTCGHIPGIAEAVKRTTILIEGEPGAEREVKIRGGIQAPGINTIILAEEYFDTANPLECVMAEIIHISFMHMARPELPEPTDSHMAGLFLAELAGFAPCREKDSPAIPGIPGTEEKGKDFWKRVLKDPMAANNKSPGCPGQPLAGPQVKGDKSKIDIKAPVFMSMVTISPKSGAAIVRIGDGMASMLSPRGAIRLDGNVQLSGNTAEFSNYEVGFIQTIVENEINIDYISGDRVKMLIPLPIRDGRPEQLGGRAPWYEPDTVIQPDSSGTVETFLSDSPSQSMSLINMDFEKSILERMKISMVDKDDKAIVKTFERNGKMQEGNALNRASKHVVFNTWLVARRIGASPDPFETRFLKGNEIIFDLSLDMVGNKGSGKFSVSATEIFDSASMQLSGIVPADIKRPSEQVTHTNPPERKKVANRQEEEQQARNFVREVNRIAEPIKLRLGLTDTLNAKILIDSKTGRIAISKPGSNAVTVTSNEKIIPQDVLDSFAQELYFNIRKDLSLPGTLGSLTVSLSNLNSGTVRPNAFTPLIERPGIKSQMNEIWKRSVSDRLNVREFSLTYFIDRTTDRISSILREGKSENEGEGHSVAICMPAEGIQSLAKQSSDISILGTVHTHADSDGRQDPSDEDLTAVKENPARCGAEHYVISEKEIFQFTGSKRITLGKRIEIIGK